MRQQIEPRVDSEMNASRALSILITVAGLLLACCGPESGEAIAFVDVNLIPMTHPGVLEDQTVLVAGSRIVAVGSSNAMHIPAGTRIIDGRGAYLMPGLADMHMHTRADWEDREMWPVHPLNLYLANGVTTIRDMAPQGSPLTYALQWGEEIGRGTRIGPTIHASGELLYASPLNDPAAVVRNNHDLGFDFIKLYSFLSVEDFHAAMTAARELGMYTTGHIPYPVGLSTALAEGMDEIAHVEELLPEFFDLQRDRSLAPEEWLPYVVETVRQQVDRSSDTPVADFEREHAADLAQLASRLAAGGIPVCTTLVIDDVIQAKLFQLEAFLERPENVYFEAGYLETLQRGEEKHQLQCRGIEDLCAFKDRVDRWALQGLHDAGVLLLLGTDSGTGGMGIVPGYSIHDELRILVENGLSPYEAIATGTVNAATVVKRMTGDGNFGTIEVGKRADLILVRGNPLVDVKHIRDPLGVMAAGRWYPEEMLGKLIEISVARPATADSGN
jgi:imidazolonepropionase-like amidohydrolase